MRFWREHPELLDELTARGEDPHDYLRSQGDRIRKEQKESGPLELCRSCGEALPVRGQTRCKRCIRQMDEDRLEQESGR